MHSAILKVAVLCLAIVSFCTPSASQGGGSSDACERWGTQIANLSSADLLLLQSEGVLNRAGRWYFSSGLLPDCGVRLQMAEYFSRTVNVHQQEGDKQFVKEHQGELGSVLLSTFTLLGTSEAVPNDGDFRDDVWILLRDSQLSGADLAKILRRELEFENGISESMISLLLQQPVKEFEPDLRNALHKQEVDRSGRISDMIFTLAALSRLERDSTATQLALARLEEDPRTTAVERNVIPKLIAKLSSGKPLEWSDLEDIALQNVD
jgi:hypothetical protein